MFIHSSGIFTITLATIHFGVLETTLSGVSVAETDDQCFRQKISAMRLASENLCTATYRCLANS